MALQVALPGFAMPVPVEALQLRHANLKATNTRDKPNRVSPVPLKEVTAGTDRVQATLAPASWNMIRLAPAALNSGHGAAGAVHRLRASNARCSRQNTNSSAPITMRVHHELSEPSKRSASG